MVVQLMAWGWHRVPMIVLLLAGLPVSPMLMCLFPCQEGILKCDHLLGQPSLYLVLGRGPSLSESLAVLIFVLNISYPCCFMSSIIR